MRNGVVATPLEGWPPARRWWRRAPGAASIWSPKAIGTIVPPDDLRPSSPGRSGADGRSAPPPRWSWAAPRRRTTSLANEVATMNAVCRSASGRASLSGGWRPPAGRRGRQMGARAVLAGCAHGGSRTPPPCRPAARRSPGAPRRRRPGAARPAPPPPSRPGEMRVRRWRRTVRRPRRWRIATRTFFVHDIGGGCVPSVLTVRPRPLAVAQMPHFFARALALPGVISRRRSRSTPARRRR